MSVIDACEIVSKGPLLQLLNEFNSSLMLMFLRMVTADVVVVCIKYVICTSN